jgi:hypothetical protein
MLRVIQSIKKESDRSAFIQEVKADPKRQLLQTCLAIKQEELMM